MTTSAHITRRSRGMVWALVVVSFLLAVALGCLVVTLVQLGDATFYGCVLGRSAGLGDDSPAESCRLLLG